jgi:hypothetical protein
VLPLDVLFILCVILCCGGDTNAVRLFSSVPLTAEPFTRKGRTLLPSRGPRTFGLLAEPTNLQPKHIKNKTAITADAGNDLSCSARITGISVKILIHMFKFTAAVP